MIERQTELRRRYHRKKKMAMLKAKLPTSTGDARATLLYKIKKLSPMWTEASLKVGPQEVATAPKAEPKEPKRKAPAKPKAEKAEKPEKGEKKS